MPPVPAPLNQDQDTTHTDTTDTKITNTTPVTLSSTISAMSSHVSPSVAPVLPSEAAMAPGFMLPESELSRAQSDPVAENSPVSMDNSIGHTSATPAKFRAGVEASPQAVNEEVAADPIEAAALAIGGYLLRHSDHLDHTPLDHTPFDANTEPLIGIEPYIGRITQYSKISPVSLICALLLVQRAGKDLGNGKLTNYNVHRLFLTACVVFAKFYDDEIDTNMRWARIAGLKVPELNHLEIELLNLLQFDLRVSPKDFADIVEVLCTLDCSSPRSSSSPPVSLVRQCPVAAQQRRKPFSILSLHSLHHHGGDKSSLSHHHHHYHPRFFNRSRSNSLSQNDIETFSPPNSRRHHKPKALTSFFHHSKGPNSPGSPREVAPLQASSNPGSPDHHVASPSLESRGFPGSPTNVSSPSSCASPLSPRSRRLLPRTTSLQSIAHKLHVHAPHIHLRKSPASPSSPKYASSPHISTMSLNMSTSSCQSIASSSSKQSARHSTESLEFEGQSGEAEKESATSPDPGLVVGVVSQRSRIVASPAVTTVALG